MQQIRSLAVESIARLGLSGLVVSWREEQPHHFIEVKKGSLGLVGAIWVVFVEVCINNGLAYSILDVSEVRTGNYWFLHIGESFLCFFEEGEKAVVEYPIIPKYQESIVIAIGGPSAVGKTTIGKRVIRKMPEEVFTYPTYTTRQRREGEVEGADYYFRNEEDLQTAHKNPYFSDFVQARGNWYWINKWEILKSILTHWDKVHLFFMTQRHEFLARKKLVPWMDWIWLDAPEDQIALRLKARGWGVPLF